MAIADIVDIKIASATAVRPVSLEEIGRYAVDCLEYGGKCIACGHWQEHGGCDECCPVRMYQESRNAGLALTGRAPDARMPTTLTSQNWGIRSGVSGVWLLRLNANGEPELALYASLEEADRIAATMGAMAAPYPGETATGPKPGVIAPMVTAPRSRSSLAMAIFASSPEFRELARRIEDVEIRELLGKAWVRETELRERCERRAEEIESWMRDDEVLEAASQ